MTELKLQRNLEYVEELKEAADSIMEAYEDLHLALIGGLAAQEFYSQRRVRLTSDIDLASIDERIVKRLKKDGYSIFYNDTLKKYSARDTKIHIDIYPRFLGRYQWDKLFWRERVKPNGWNIYLASPEDMLAIKLYAWLTSERGRTKHLIDYYTILVGPEEIRLSYFENRLKKLSKEIGVNFDHLLKSLPLENSALAQFNSKEKRFIKSEMERIKKELSKNNL